MSIINAFALIFLGFILLYALYTVIGAIKDSVKEYRQINKGNTPSNNIQIKSEVLHKYNYRGKELKFVKIHFK